MNAHVFERAEYPRIRATLMDLHHQMLRLPNKDDVSTCARHLGLWHKKNVVFNNNSEVSLLANYQVYAYRPRGFNLAELYLRLNRASLDEFRVELLTRMSAAHFAVLKVEAVGKNETLRVIDVLRRDTLTLVDQGLSSSLCANQAIAGHLLDLGDFSIQTGAMVPADRELLRAEEPMRVLTAIGGPAEGGAFRITPGDGAKLARAVVAAAIRQGYTEHVHYSDYS